MKFLISGGTGFIGSSFIKAHNIAENKFIILTRNKDKAEKKFANINKYNNIIFVKSLENLTDFEEIDIVLNFAGEPIADKKWCDKQKAILLESRINITKDLYNYIKILKQKPKFFVSASAIGYYGRNDDYTNLSEESPKGNEFTSDLCASWEYEAKKFAELSINTAIIRLGIVLGKNQGALKKMLPAFKLNLGGKLGSGKQVMSWIHIDDVISAIDYLINKNLSGIFNLTSPNPVSNEEFSKILASKLNRLSIFNMPSFVVKILFGEMGDALLLNGQKVLPKRLLSENFKFKFDNLEQALGDIVN